MSVETEIAHPVQSSEASVGNLFDAAVRDTMNPPAEIQQQVEAPKEVQTEVTPEAKVEPAVQKTPEPAPKKGDEKYKWGELKDKATKYDEVVPKLTEYEKRIAEYDKKVADTEARYKTLEDEKRGYETEITENRTWRMAFDLENTPEYQAQVTRPFMEAKDNIETLASKFAIDPSEMWNVATEVDEVAREKGIYALLRDHEEGPVVQKLLAKQIDKLDKAQQTHVEQVKHAEGLRNQINARQSSQQQEKTIKQQEEEHKARTESWGLLKQTLSLPEIFDSKDASITTALEEIQNAELEDTPMARAIAARAVPMMGLLAKQFREVTAKLQADLAARDKTIADISGSRPGGFRPSSPAAPKQVQSADAAWDAMAQAAGMR